MSNQLDWTSHLFQIVIKENSIFYFNDKRGMMFHLSLDSNLSSNSVDSFDLKEVLSNQNFFKINPTQPFAVINSNIYLPIGNYSSRKRFFDEFMYLKFSTKTKTSSKVISTPRVYKQGKRRPTGTSLISFTDDTAIAFFETTDELQILSLEHDRIISTSNYNPYSSYTDFDYDKRKDLGYSRFYSETSEINEKVFIAKDYCVIIKRIARKSLHEKPKFEYLLLDNNQNILRYNKFEDAIIPQLSFSYKNGFASVSSDLSSIYYYEVK